MAKSSNSRKDETTTPFLSSLSSKHLLLVVGSLFAIDMFILDPLPFVDEIILGIATILIARWQMRGGSASPEAETRPPAKDVTPPR